MFFIKTNLLSTNRNQRFGMGSTPFRQRALRQDEHEGVPVDRHHGRRDDDIRPDCQQLGRLVMGTSSQGGTAVGGEMPPHGRQLDRHRPVQRTDYVSETAIHEPRDF